jgi:uncharacterized protein (TIGR04255 family)
MKHYKKPPIVEAALSIYLESPPQGISVNELEDACMKIAKKYPHKSPRRRYQNKLEFDASGTFKGSEGTDLGLDGYLCKSVDERQVVQFCFDRFVFNRLAPYEGWKPFFSEAMSLWEEYSLLMKPTLIKKISLRNINRIDIPTEKQEELSQYLILAPQLPTGLPTTLKGFAHETIFTVDLNTQVTLIQTIRSIDVGTTTIFLDIDVSLPVIKSYEKELFNKYFSYLRGVKNNIFENCLTDKIKKDFE